MNSSQFNIFSFLLQAGFFKNPQAINFWQLIYQSLASPVPVPVAVPAPPITLANPEQTIAQLLKIDPNQKTDSEQLLVKDYIDIAKQIGIQQVDTIE
uniref:hypothetical protein n=1 Tax=Synechococcus lacustris TaxID=2116544 RepID=UPI00333FF492